MAQIMKMPFVVLVMADPGYVEQLGERRLNRAFALGRAVEIHRERRVHSLRQGTLGALDGIVLQCIGKLPAARHEAAFVSVPQ